MRTILFLLAFGLAAVAASPTPGRIVGGSTTTINNYPMAVAMLFSPSGHGTFNQNCGGSILNVRSILTAAHCTFPFRHVNWRGRVGSTNAHSGGVVHNINSVINHPNYVASTTNNDISICRVSVAIAMNINVSPGNIAGSNYNVPDQAPVWAIGWGRTSQGGQSSEQLRHVQIWVVNQAVCRQNYATINRAITDTMLCAGWLNVGGRDQCQGDSGGPLFHGRVIVGVCSWGHGCAHPSFPGVNARVARFTSWISSNS